jgi:hypothetical protein
MLNVIRYLVVKALKLVIKEFNSKGAKVVSANKGVNLYIRTI